MRRFMIYTVALLVLLGVAATLNGNPASRMTDTQQCPLFCEQGTQQVPHVGGPISTGEQTVLICGQPAARVGDLATCQCGAPPIITTGSNTVFIGGQPAARVGSVTNHGGTVVMGCNSVDIGG